MRPKPGDPVKRFATQAAFERWLERNCDKADCLWIQFAKKGSGHRSIVFAEALDVALCFGWIDGQTARLDDDWYLQRFTPRRKRSKWSQINTQNAERLIAEGRMRPPGMAQVEAAKADGRWDAAYPPPSKISVPPDLEAALAAAPRAAEFFKTLDSTNRYAVLYRIEDAKRPETRARRIKQFVEMLDRGETLH